MPTKYINIPSKLRNCKRIVSPISNLMQHPYKNRNNIIQRFKQCQNEITRIIKVLKFAPHQYLFESLSIPQRREKTSLLTQLHGVLWSSIGCESDFSRLGEFVSYLDWILEIISLNKIESQISRLKETDWIRKQPSYSNITPYDFDSSSGILLAKYKHKARMFISLDNYWFEVDSSVYNRPVKQYITIKPRKWGKKEQQSRRWQLWTFEKSIF